MATYFTKNDAGEFVEIEVDDAKELKEALNKERDAHKTAKERAKELELLTLNSKERKPHPAYPILPIDKDPKPAGVPLS